MPISSRNILIFINQDDVDGHSADIRFALHKALHKIDHAVFQDLPKKPENTFDAVIDEILISKAVLLDGIAISQKIPPDLLVQYGICYPLNKRCFFLIVDNNSCMVRLEANSRVIEGIVHFEYYLDLEVELKIKITKWLEDSSKTYKDESTKKPVHAFEVFGVDQHKNPDLFEEINNFPAGTDWKPRFHSDLGSFSALQELSRSIGARSFNIFCLEEENEENIFIGIGIAIGMGRPFLIIKRKDVKLPLSLIGYNGILEYDSFTQLRYNLKQYTQDFLSDKVLEWKGSTYYSILARLEMQINQYDANELERAENIINTVNSALGTTLARSYALLGDIYREKNRKISPNDASLLLKAKEFYEQALRIQKDYKRCEDALTVIDRHIELIDLLTNHQYKSFPRLLTLIGENLTSKNYSYIREYLISEVNKLIQNKEYVNAIALLAAMQVHDKSEEIQKLIDQTLKVAPGDLPIEAIQDLQKYVIELENEKSRLSDEIRIKENRIGELSSQLDEAKLSAMKSKEKILETEKERDELKTKLESLYAQFLSVQQTKEKLEKLVTDDVLRNKIETARKLSGRGVVVNFGGLGWAVYKTFDGTPHVIRDEKTLSVYEGFVLIDGDKIDDDIGKGETYLSPDTLVIDPHSELYQRIIRMLNEDN